MLIFFSGRTKEIFFLVIKLEPPILSWLQPRKNNSVPTELDVSISALVCCIFGLMNAEGQQNNLSCQSIEIRAGIRIEVVGQPNILVPLGRFTTYVLWKMQWMTWLRWKWGKLANFLLFRYTAQLYTVLYSRTCHVSIRISYIGRRLMLI